MTEKEEHPQTDSEIQGETGSMPVKTQEGADAKCADDAQGVADGRSGSDLASQPASGASGGDRTSDPSSDAAAPKKRGRGALVVICAVVLLAAVLFFGGAGMLGVSVVSSSGAANGADVEIALYSDDVVRELVDDDPSNDPEPIEVKKGRVGQSTSFSVRELGTHTVAVTFVDEEDAPVLEPDPATVSMFGIDRYITVEVA